MVFSSITFLYYFLPAVLILYWITPKRFKNSTLLAASLVFYAWGEPKYVFVMLASVLAGYVCAIGITRCTSAVWRKVWLWVSVCACVGALGYFKYADFFIENFSAITGINVPLLGVVLPIGISFYTFQILSYTVDVYRGAPAVKNPIELAAYISLFPQLIAGPIVRYSDIALQMKERSHSADKIAQGIRRFILGLSKKVLIANTMGQLCSQFGASDDKSVMFYWLYAIAYTLQVYFDFSGYSDMAIGLGKLLGFDFRENFNYPYISKSITEFWRRWHISLGSWFRDYVYIPLGGNRAGLLKQLRNILIVWLLTGFWHGAEWNFVLWGAMFAVLLTVEKLWLYKRINKFTVLSRVYVMFFVIISFVIFSITDISQAVNHIGAMFGAGDMPLVSPEFWYYFKSNIILIIAGIAGATPIPALTVKRMGKAKVMSVVEPIVLAALLILSTAYLVDGSFNPFLYFRF